MKFFLMFFILFYTSSVTFSQTENKAITLQASTKMKIIMRTSEIKKEGNLFYVWISKIYNEPEKISFLEEKVKTKKTFYLINPELSRYSILEVKYFDDGDNLIERFDYNRESEILEYQFNFTVLKNSLEEEIINELKKVKWSEN